MRRNDKGIAVPGEESPLPWHESLGGIRASNNAWVLEDEFIDDDDMDYAIHAANFHERFADIVRRLEDVNRWARHGISTVHAAYVIAISEDAAALWAEYKEEPK